MALTRIDKLELAGMLLAFAAIWLAAGCQFDNRIHIREVAEPAKPTEAIAIADFSVGLGGIKGFENVPNLVDGHIEAGRTIIDIKMPALTMLANVAIKGTSAATGLLSGTLEWVAGHGKKLAELIL